ncbi:MAG: T9SS type A sorting domain-containing protein [Bacteroidota bacterium]
MKRVFYSLILGNLIGISAAFAACDIQVGFTGKSMTWSQLQSKAVNGVIYLTLDTDIDSLGLQFTSPCSNITIKECYFNDMPVAVNEEQQSGGLIKTKTTGTGLYKIQVVGPQNNDWFKIVIKAKGSTSINEFNGDLHFALYPNPTSDKLTIESVDAVKQIQVYDNKGMLVMEKQNNVFNEFQTIDVAALPNGQYFMICSNDDKKSSMKFIKQ